MKPVRLVPIVLTLAALPFAGCGTASREEERPAKDAPPQIDNSFPIDRGSAGPDTAVVAPVPPFSVGPAGTGTLVLYDRRGPWGWLGELYAMNAGSLAGHFGAWTAKPVGQYEAGEMKTYTAVVYIGSTFDEPLPEAFLDDVLLDSHPVVWIDSNIWQLATRAGKSGTPFAATYGFEPWVFDTADVAQVRYKGASLTRHAANRAGIMSYSSVTSANVLAEAVRSSNDSRFPWALRGRRLTYIGENPFAFVTANDRYLVFADLLFDALAPDTPERHRALVRIEDVSPRTDPGELRAIADYLASEHVPFSVATVPRFLDPKGYYGKVGTALTFRDTPDVAKALAYMVERGGTLVLHGYTHQYAAKENPYNGASEDDFEFYTAHVDAENYVRYDGPVPEDSEAWANQRVAAAFEDLAAVNLPRPAIFEYPHYAGSLVDSRAIRTTFPTVYHRGLYFGGTMTAAAPDYTRMIGVMYPYAGTDVFGFRVIPENLGSYAPTAANNNAPRKVADLVGTARANRVVRDGVASFYFHPYYELGVLKELVRGIRAEGYTFVGTAEP